MLSLINCVKKVRNIRFLHRVLIVSIACTLLQSPGVLPSGKANAGTISTDGLVINYDHSSFTSESYTVKNLVAGKTNATLRRGTSTATPTMGGSTSRNYFTTTTSATTTAWQYANDFIYTDTPMNQTSFGDRLKVSAFAWIYPTTANHVVLEERGSNYDAQTWYDTQIEMVNQYYNFRLWGCTPIANPSTTTLNAWHYVGFTYDGNTLTGYVDGVSVVSAACARQTPFDYGDLYYGVGTNAETDMNTSGVFNGGFRFGALHIYNKSLTASQVSTNATTKISQSLTLNTLSPSSKTFPYSQTLNMTTSGSSGSGAVTYTVSNGTAIGCSLSNASSTATLTASTAGTCSVFASIASDNFFDGATSAASEFTFSKAPQSLSFATTSYSKTYGETQTVLASSAGTGTITYSSGASTACTILGDTVTITASSGTCTITASRAADDNYLAAVSANSVTVSVFKAVQATLTLTSTSAVFLTNLRLLTSGGSGPGAVSYSVSDSGTAGCAVADGDSLTSISAGTCVVVATKATSTDYLATYDTRTVTVGKASLALTTSVSATLKYGSSTTATYISDRSLGVGLVLNLTGTLAFETSTTTACTVNAATGVVTMYKASGTCSVRVSLRNDMNYLDTSSVLVSITPALADALAITAANVTTTYTGATAAITPSYSISGLQLSDTVTVDYNYSGTTNAGANYLLSATKPSEAGTYSIIPTISISNSDSYTAATSLTNGILTILRASRTLSPTTYDKSTLKYGESATVISNLTSPSSDSDGIFSYAVGSGCSINSSTGEITANAYFGSCLETTTLSQGNNFESATATAFAFTLSKADTLTVTTVTAPAVTYTGSAAAVTPTITVSGLVAGNTATGATFNYSRAPSCALGGTCQVGDFGPGGGKVFYISGSAINTVSGISGGGIYLEMAPSNFSKATYNWCEGPDNPYTTLLGSTATAIGSGAENTKTMIDNCTGGAGVQAADLSLGGQSDWFLPSYGELVEIYSQRSMLGLGAGKYASTYLYWSSTEADTWIASSLVPWAGIGGQNKAQATPYLPIRAFSPTFTTHESPTSSPTNAGKYQITPSSLTLADGVTTDYYAATVYETATLTINKATQSEFTNYWILSGVFGSAFPIYKYGGSGDGVESIETTNGSATGCVLTGFVLSTATAGTCTVSATKESSENYSQYDSLIYVYLYYYVPEPAIAVSTMPTQIAISTGTGLIVNSTIGPIITGMSSSSGPVGTVVTFTGTNFDGVDVIKIGRKVLTSVTVVNSTTVTGVIPAGATTGPIFISNSLGSDFNSDGFTVTP